MDVLTGVSDVKSGGVEPHPRRPLLDVVMVNGIADLLIRC
jgi:hypothetical protein